MRTTAVSLGSLVIRPEKLSETLLSEPLVYWSQGSVVHLYFRLDVRLLSGKESCSWVDPLSGGFSRWRQNDDTVKQKRGSPISLHLIEPDEIHARRRARSSGDRHVVRSAFV